MRHETGERACVFFHNFPCTFSREPESEKGLSIRPRKYDLVFYPPNGRPSMSGELLSLPDSIKKKEDKRQVAKDTDKSYFCYLAS